jgi:hypothetical protein
MKLALHFVRWLGYNPLKASEGLFGLSNTMGTYNSERVLHKATVQKALKIPNL